MNIPVSKDNIRFNPIIPINKTMEYERYKLWLDDMNIKKPIPTGISNIIIDDKLDGHLRIVPITKITEFESISGPTTKSKY